MIVVIVLVGAGGLVWLLYGGGKKVRHVIVISIDTCRADYLSCYGYERQTTPNIDAVANEGVLFENVVAPVPMTLPAHSSMMTGTIPAYHGAHHNFSILAESNVTLAEMMQERGYRTGAIVSAFVLDSRFGLDQGFDSYHDHLEGARPDDRLAERKGENTTKLALAWLEEHYREPFFFFLHYFDPHMQYEPPRPFAMKYPDNFYAGEIAFTDHLIGRIITKLKGLGIYDSTLLVIAGDHGESLGEHGEDEHSFFIYQGVVKVPLIIKRPGRHQAVRVKEVVGLIDIVPTIAGQVGLELPEQVQGMDLAAYWSGNGAQDEQRYMYCESLTATQLDCNPLVGLVTERWKYIHTTRPELYDLEGDPREETNLATQEPKRARSLQGRLMQMLADYSGAGPAAAQAELDSGALQRLLSLGYVGAYAVSHTIEFEDGRRDPKDLIGYFKKKIKAVEYYNTRQFAKSKRFCQEMLAERPEIAYPYGVLAEIACMEGDVAKGIALCRRGLTLQPGDYDAGKLHNTLGIILNQQGQYGEAVTHLTEAIGYVPDNPDAISLLADILANCSDEQVRRPEHAVTLAQRACELTRYDQPKFLDILAAAYAAAGRFDEAVAQAEKALELAVSSGRKDMVAPIQKRMESYKLGQPYQQEEQGDQVN